MSYLRPSWCNTHLILHSDNNDCHITYTLSILLSIRLSVRLSVCLDTQTPSSDLISLVQHSAAQARNPDHSVTCTTGSKSAWYIDPCSHFFANNSCLCGTPYHAVVTIKQWNFDLFKVDKLYFSIEQLLSGWNSLGSPKHSHRWM